MRRITIWVILLIIGFALSTTQLNFARSRTATNSKVFSVANFPPHTQDIFAQVESLIQQGRQQGLDYLNSKDDKTKKSAKKSLEEAEKLIKKELKKEPNCEKCFEFLTVTYFYQTYFGFSKDYDDCLKTAGEGLTKFPANSRLGYLKGSAYYNSGQYSESIRTFNRLLMNPDLDAQSTAQVNQV